MAIRKQVKCSFCGNDIIRVTWNYQKKKKVENFFCNNKCKGSWQILQREKLGYTKEWLIDQYIIQEKSADQIAREVGRDPKRVWEWIVNYGIRTRPRGHNTDHLPKDGSTFKGRKHTEENKKKFRDMRLKDGHVPYLKDGKHWLHHEGSKSPNWKGGITPERQSIYSSKEWVNAVKEVWKRDNAICKRCNKRHNDKKHRGTFHIHHLFSFAEYDSLRCNADNLVLLCKECHLWVHSNNNKNNEFLPIKGDLPKWI